MESHQQYTGIINILEERAKELNCLYTVEELLNKSDTPIENITQGIIDAIPHGWQYPAYCKVKITIGENEYVSQSFKESKWLISSDIEVQEETVGRIDVYYIKELPRYDIGPFLKEEMKLLKTIADRLGHYILHDKLKNVFVQWKNQKNSEETQSKPEWSIILDLLRKTDQHLSAIISRKMLNHLFYKGINESNNLYKRFGNYDDDEIMQTEVNKPSKKQLLEDSANQSIEIFEMAARHYSESKILSLILKWINEEKSASLVRVLSNSSSKMSEISDAIRRYYLSNSENSEISSPGIKGLKVSLIRRFLTEQLEYINIAKNYYSIKDFNQLIDKLIFAGDSHGKLGGKSAGLILAMKIVEFLSDEHPELKKIKSPKTWYIASDAVMNFVYYNSLEDVFEHKYREMEEIRSEYPYIIQAFKNSIFPQEIINGLSRALDDFDVQPIIVRSSSLLEDRIGSAFAGKYKSLFLANQGTKEERLEALTDAVAEVYASTFGPDPIGYRNERGLIDFNEEMGIMIQELVGKRIGKYFFPAYAGVAFSNNEFRWSHRIKRNDGLIRIVPGLGTRAVDRIGDDYPIMIAPGLPSLRVNLTYDEMVAYSPKYIDVIDLEQNTFETISIQDMLDYAGNNFPMLNLLFSINDERHLKKPIGLGIDTRKHNLTVTFENLFENSGFINLINLLLKGLSSKLGYPVDIEFASNGEDLYLLQCRPQSLSASSSPAKIPTDILKSDIVFSAEKYVSNGTVSKIEYIVYVDPEIYSTIENLDDLKGIGHAVGKLNKLLPHKKFILMGPGRWGSRGDIKLGVSVTYADINNTAMLIEIARSKGNYTPDLSFGTHFFQDLVESGIKYLPLYPDDTNIDFNIDFLLNSVNEIENFISVNNKIKNCIRLIDVSKAASGRLLNVCMNADESKAIAFLK